MTGTSDHVAIQATFVNEAQSMESMPRLADEDFVAVDPKYLRVSLVSLAIVALFVVAGGVVGAALVDRTWVPLTVMAGVLMLLALMAGLRTIGVRNIAYQVRTHDLSYRNGVVIKRVSTVPFVRVQHARIRQGPVERRFGLATLEINSAGPNIAIEGLAIETAEAMKGLVVERAGDLVEEP